MLKDFFKGLLVLLIIVAFTAFILPFTPYEFSFLETYVPLMNSESWIQNVSINYNFISIITLLIISVSSAALYKLSKEQ